MLCVIWTLALALVISSVSSLAHCSSLSFVFHLYQSIVDLPCCVSYCCTAKWFSYTQASLVPQMVKKSAYKTGDPGLISGTRRLPGEENGYPLQYSCLQNSMDRETWWATVHTVPKSQTQLWLMLSYIYIYFLKKYSFSIRFTIGYWKQFPVLYRRTLLFQPLFWSLNIHPDRSSLSDVIHSLSSDFHMAGFIIIWISV